MLTQPTNRILKNNINNNLIITAPHLQQSVISIHILDKKLYKPFHTKKIGIMKRIHIAKNRAKRIYEYPYKALTITGPVPEIDDIRMWMKKHRLSYKLAIFLFIELWSNLEPYERRNTKNKVKAKIYREGKYRPANEEVPLLIKRDGQVIAKFIDPFLIVPYIDQELQKYVQGKTKNDITALFNQPTEIQEIKTKLKELQVNKGEKK